MLSSVIRRARSSVLRHAMIPVLFLSFVYLLLLHRLATYQHDNATPGLLSAAEQWRLPQNAWAPGAKEDLAIPPPPLPPLPPLPFVISPQQRLQILAQWQTRATEAAATTRIKPSTTAQKNTCAALFDYEQTQLQQDQQCLYHIILKSSACRVGTVQIQLDHIQGPRGNESALAVGVAGRSEESEFLRFSPGTFQVTQALPSRLLPSHSKNHPQYNLLLLKDAFQVVPELSNNTLTTTRSSPRKDADGRPVVNILVRRNTYANPCFIISTIYSVFLLLFKFQLFHHFVRIIWLDGHAWTSADSIWRGLFDEVTFVQHLNDKGNETRVVLENVHVLNTENAFLNNALAYHRLGDICPKSSSLHDFRQFMYQLYNVTPKEKAPNNNNNNTNKNDTRPLLIFLTRNHHKAHPRSSGKTDRTLANPQEELQYLQKTYPNYDIEVVSFEELPFRNQLLQIAKTDLLISVHGAGNIHVVFLPLHAKFVEYFPPGFDGRVRFRYLASALGIQYEKQTARVVKRDAATGFVQVTLIPPNVRRL